MAWQLLPLQAFPMSTIKLLFCFQEITSFPFIMKSEIGSVSPSGLRSFLLDYYYKRKKRHAVRKFCRNGRIELRYIYDLAPESMIFDCGAFLGDFAAEMIRRYGCKVFCFEPVPAYFDQLSKRFADNPRVECLNFGIAPVSGSALISVEKEASSLFRTETNDSEAVQLLDISEALQLAGGGKIDLLKLNIEGAEFDLLDAILARNLANQFRHIQVQFHQVVPDFHKRWLKIRSGLANTHYLTFDYYFAFESWSQRSTG
jgi:FkbM family methyltransferase